MTKPTGLPPGPPLPPRLQSLALKVAPLTFLEACRRRYGDVVMIRTVFIPEFVVIFGPALARRLLQGSYEELHVADARAPISQLLGQRSVVVLDGQEHLERRRQLLPPFHGERMRASAAVIRAATDRAIDSWPEDRPFELLPAMQEVTFEVISRVVFGLEHETQHDELLRRLRTLPDPFRPNRTALRVTGGSVPEERPIDDLLFEEVARRSAEPDLEERGDVLSLLLLARRNGRDLPDQDLRDNLVTLLIAGHETTATALAWSFDLLLRNRPVLERLEAEIARGDESYLNSVVNESLRLRPPALFVGRQVRDEPYELGGYAIPPGMEIRASVGTIQRLTAHYPDARAFRPDRFLGPDPPEGSAWLAFGGGVHRCLGASFAAFEMAQVTRRVVERAHLDLADRRPERARVTGLTQSPARGLRVRYRPKATAAGEPAGGAQRSPEPEPAAR